MTAGSGVMVVSSKFSSVGGASPAIINVDKPALRAERATASSTLWHRGMLSRAGRPRRADTLSVVTVAMDNAKRSFSLSPSPRTTSSRLSVSASISNSVSLLLSTSASSSVSTGHPASVRASASAATQISRSGDAGNASSHNSGSGGPCQNGAPSLRR